MEYFRFRLKQFDFIISTECTDNHETYLSFFYRPFFFFAMILDCLIFS